MNYEQARLNMIQQQIRPWSVPDQAILDLFAGIHREDFVPSEYKRLALADINIPLAHSQITMTPKVEARLLQALTVHSEDEILEIGTGCGYLTALLSRVGHQVHSIDIFPEFIDQTAAKLQSLNIGNVALACGNAAHGWEQAAPYDVIAVTGSIPILEHSLPEQLNIGGRLFITIGQPPVMQSLLIKRTGESTWLRKTLFETDLPRLIGAPEVQQFEL